jgi:two-component system NtrC family sensor kinase
LPELLERSARPRRVEGWEVMALPLVAAPWRVLIVASEREITMLVLERLWPYALLLSGVVVTLVLAQQLLDRFFVGPALALAGRVQEQSEGEPKRAPRVPGVWQPWFAAVDEAFQADRRHLAQAREAHALKAAIVEAAFDSIVTVDEAGRVLEFSKGAEAIFGYPRAEALGRPIAELIIPPHLRERHAQGMRRYLATGERRVLGQRIEIEGLRADGSLFPVELAIAEIRLEDRRLFTAYLRDITERRQAEQALQDSERQFRAVVEDQTELICRFDPDFRLTFSNRAHARLFGVEPEALLGQNFFASIPAELREPLRQELLALTRENPIQMGENEKILGNGEVRWFAWTNHALFDNAGRRTGYQSVGRDVTSQKQADQALRESAAELALIADGIPLAVAIARTDRPEILFANRQAQEILGLRPGCQPEQVTAVYQDLADRERLLRLVAGVGRVEGFEVQMRGKNGAAVWALISARTIHFRGTPAMLAVITDITERRRMEQALRNSEARLAAFMQHAPVGMYLKDLDGRYLMANPEMAKVFGRPVAEMLGRTPEDVFAPTEAAMIRGYDREVVESGATSVREEYLAGLEDYAWSMVIRFPIRNEAGRITHIAGFDVDITKQKRTEYEVQRQREAAHLREKLASLGSLLANVAHELNNPLSVVVGRAIMLEDEADDPAVRASLGRLRAAAERCARIVKSFLALAREKPREAQPVDVRKVLDAVLDLAYGLRSAGVETRREDAPDLPPVVADEAQLHQVFLNLLINALQALEMVPPPRLLWLRTAAEDGVVRIEVVDNGPGVPTALRKQILEPFFTTKPVGAGTGLGLSVCHSIITAHHGTITVDERPGGGARFVVTLPVCRTEVGLSGPLPASTGGSVGGDVLVVDDEAEVVAMLEEALARDGHRVVTAPDGAAALELLRKGWFDAVLCDLRMPRLDGPGLARELEAIRPDLAVRLLLMTGDTLRAGAAMPPEARDRLLEKPLDPDEVRRRVQELVTGAR